MKKNIEKLYSKRNEIENLFCFSFQLFYCINGQMDVDHNILCSINESIHTYKIALWLFCILSAMLRIALCLLYVNADDIHRTNNKKKCKTKSCSCCRHIFPSVMHCVVVFGFRSIKTLHNHLIVLRTGWRVPVKTLYFMSVIRILIKKR